jgi:photosystem II stability/assembly factor-like uncharacterized protein
VTTQLPSRERSDATTGPEPMSPDVLFEEARQRRRRRWICGSVLTGAVIAGTVIFGMAGGGGGGHGARSRARPPAGSPSGSRNQSVDRSVLDGRIPNLFLVYSASPMRAIVASSKGVLATTDGGKRWRNITPHQWATEAVLVSHIDGIASVGDRIWLAPVGSQPLDFIPYTDNGGRVWRIARLPGEPLVDGSLSFWNATDGRVLGESIDGRTYIYQTANGGRSWTRLSRVGAQLTGAPITFTSARSGWTWNDRGVLSRTEDGGRTWNRVQLPRISGYRTYTAPSNGDYRAWAWVPTFPSKRAVVEPGLVRSKGGGRRTVFYVSRNGGASFTATLAPSGAGDPGTAYAASTDDWYVTSGNQLFHTANAGKSWTKTRVQVSTHTPIDLVNSLSSTVGWAETTLKIGYFYPTVLLHTSDGGHTWQIARAS